MTQAKFDRLWHEVINNQQVFDDEILLDYWRARVREWCKNRPVSDNEKQPTRNGKGKENTN